MIIPQVGQMMLLLTSFARMAWVPAQLHELSVPIFIGILLFPVIVLTIFWGVIKPIFFPSGPGAV